MKPINPIKAFFPKVPKVIGDASREPVNKQAAMIIAPANWLYKPLPPEKDPSKNVHLLMEEINLLKGKLYDAHQSVERCNITIKNLRDTCSDYRRTIETINKELTSLKSMNSKLTNSLLDCL